MRRYFALLMCMVLLCVAIFPVAVSAGDSKTLRVGLYENPPKIFTDSEGNVLGFWPDIIEYIASEEGWEIEYIHGTWAECLERLEKNEIDVMPDTGFTEPRSKKFAFSNETVLVSWSMVYAQEGVDIQSILDLEGKTIAVLRGSVNVEGPEGIKEIVGEFDIDCTFTEVDSYTKVFELLESKKADVGVANKDFGSKYEEDFDVVGTPIVFQPAHIQFAFTKDSGLTPYLIERIDYQMKELKADGGSVYYQSMEKYLGVKPEEKPVVPGWVKWLLAGVGGLALLFFGESLILRSRVLSRTKELRQKITERRQAESELKQTIDRHRLLMDNSVDGVWFSVFEEPIDITLPEEEIVRLMAEREVIVEANDALAKMQGFDSGSQLIGKYWSTLESAENNLQANVVMVRCDYGYDRRIHAGKDSEGNTAYFENSEVGNIVDGKLVSAFGMTRNITERVRMETEKKEVEHMAYITSRLASIGGMAAGIAHEINNPLTSVIGFADLLLEREDVPDDIRQSLEVIHSGSVRVADIVRQLLTFARQDRIKNEGVNVNEIIQNTLAMTAYTMKSENIEVETYLADGLPGTMGAAGQLQQVFLNIIVNADAEMKKAHGKGKLQVKTEAIDDTIRISFKDDGPGIAPEILDRIFDPFFTTKDVGEGTGLGLSICHGIIAEHRGRLYARSELGHGATFIVELPVIAVQEQGELTETVVDEAEKVAGAKILVVDDEPGVRKFLKQVLTARGHNVETVDNAEEALEKIKGGRCDLILTDIKMPGMSGIELYKNVQKISRALARRVMFITGDVISVGTMDFLSRAEVAHITKPFDVEKLVKDINHMLVESRR
ncbi:MAG: transporter substrate-binding domain-containing protein [Dehalococcoidia bacterium]|nr:transporter substrate-binding domain-containing protein [Dehalococcoidia bacterium]